MPKFPFRLDPLLALHDLNGAAVTLLQYTETRVVRVDTSGASHGLQVSSLDADPDRLRLKLDWPEGAGIGHRSEYSRTACQRQRRPHHFVVAPWR
ncbi:hypothetical protein [Deinococcus sp.]|uniref:hypothetical protein n=1 Tax=Deinococcus sp. TaxID=47478 RepID=UPI003CC61393